MNNTIIICLLCLICSCGDRQNNNGSDPDQQLVTTKTDSVSYNCDYLGQEPPGNTPQLFSPNFISTNVEHSAVMITPGGNEIWFGRMYPSKIWYLENLNGNWSEIQKAPLDDRYYYLYPILSPDGNRLYFTTDRPTVPGQGRLNRGDGDIWYIDREAGAWSEPFHLGEEINFGNRHSIGSVSASGNIYLTVRTGTSYDHQTKIYFAEYKNSSYSTPILIKELNSVQPSHSPFVSPDDSYIILSSFRGGSGLSDLFISFKDSNGVWTQPKNLGPAINSAAKDEFPYITPDREYLFFNSSRVSDINKTKIQNGPGNMYWVDASFIEKLKPTDKK